MKVEEKEEEQEKYYVTTAICFVFDWTAVPDAMNHRKFDKATKNDAGTNLES